MVTEFVSILANHFSLKDLGTLSYFLGIEVVPKKHGMLLSQRRYIMDLLARTHVIDSKPVQTSLPTDANLTLHSGAALSDPTEFRAIIGSLQYLLLTRLDIAVAVNKLSQYMHRPTAEH